MYPGKQQVLSASSNLQSNTGQLIYSFVDKTIAPCSDNIQTSGNPCLLFAGRLGDNTLSASPRAHTYCVSSTPDPQTIDCPTITLQCHAPDGTAIHCCGHGLLAAAHYWMQALDTDQLSLVMGDNSATKSTINSFRRNSCLWLQFGPVAIDACELAEWINVFSSQSHPIAAATVGDNNGYLILQWPDMTDLAQITIDIDRIADATQRAVICTAAQPDADNSVAVDNNEVWDDIQLRYFAPQYGVAEDTATGSAMRILAAYWADRFQSLRATQRSERGGVLYSRYLPYHIEIGGYCLTAHTNREVGND